MNLYFFFIFAFPQTTDTTQSPEQFQVRTFVSYEKCLLQRAETVLEFSTKRLPYRIEITLCQKVERDII